MSQVGASFTAAGAGGHGDDEVTAQGLIAVYNCSRLGRVANPPSFSFTEWFRGARRR